MFDKQIPVTIGKYTIVTLDGKRYLRSHIDPDLFWEETSFMEALNKISIDKELYGELGHPAIKPNEPNFNRILSINLSNVVVRFHPDTIRSVIENDILTVSCIIFPTGPKDYLCQSILNMGGLFAPRCITSDRIIDGKVVKYIRSFITWDLVYGEYLPLITSLAEYGINGAVEIPSSITNADEFYAWIHKGTDLNSSALNQ